MADGIPTDKLRKGSRMTKRMKIKHIISGNGPFICSGCDFYSSDVTRASYHDGMVSEEDVVVIGHDGAETTLDSVCGGSHD
jgi:hypothetical protein